MLVALQRTGEDRVLPPAVGHLVELLRSWGPGPDHLTGLALVGVSLPSRLGARFVDALVFTRSGVVVIAAHAPGPGEWPGPGDRTGAAVEAAKGALAGHEGGQYVTGLVAVVPPVPQPLATRSGPATEPPENLDAAPGSSGTQPRPGAVPPASLDPAPEPPATPPGPPPVPAFRWREPDPVPGVAVVLAHPRSLRRIIGQHNRWRTVWSADDILDACYALSLAHLAPPRAALLADGFPARLPVRSRLPELPAVVPLPPAPVPVVVDDETAWIAPVRGASSAVFPRPRPIRQVPWGLVFVLTVLVAAGIVAAVFVAQVFHGS
ncbi:hypothetical protein [Amycolatopsis sp. NPDC004625]|uniref:hypothetical protein n=1 Tax=Amycolatopsis sp. NPDC004625 TaxID=3154670 RepID=UPI0033B57FBE